VLDHFGERAEILHAISLLDDAMTERRRARLAADAAAQAATQAAQPARAAQPAGQR
jgi:hypothetical protein